MREKWELTSRDWGRFRHVDGEIGAAVADFRHWSQFGAILGHMRHTFLMAVVPTVRAPHTWRKVRSSRETQRGRFKERAHLSWRVPTAHGGSSHSTQEWCRWTSRSGGAGRTSWQLHPAFYLSPAAPPWNACGWSVRGSAQSACWRKLGAAGRDLCEVPPVVPKPLATAPPPRGLIPTAEAPGRENQHPWRLYWGWVVSDETYLQQVHKHVRLQLLDVVIATIDDAPGVGQEGPINHLLFLLHVGLLLYDLEVVGRTMCQILLQVIIPDPQVGDIGVRSQHLMENTD